MRVRSRPLFFASQLRESVHCRALLLPVGTDCFIFFVVQAVAFPAPCSNTNPQGAKCGFRQCSCSCSHGRLSSLVPYTLCSFQQALS
jgi:hypothetical protein